MSKPVWSYTAAGARKPPTPCGGGNFPGALDAGLALAHPVGTCLLLTLLVSTVTGFLVEFAHGIQILPPTPIEDAELLVQVTLDSQGTAGEADDLTEIQERIQNCPVGRLPLFLVTRGRGDRILELDKLTFPPTMTWHKLIESSFIL